MALHGNRRTSSPSESNSNTQAAWSSVWKAAVRQVKLSMFPKSHIHPRVIGATSSIFAIALSLAK